MSQAEGDPNADTASSVVLSYPSDLSAWGRDKLDGSPFRAYLTKTLGRVEEGQVTEQFTGVGCCGDTLDVPLRVESVEGGRRVDESTTIEYAVRDACGVEGGWRVQSAGGPTE
ncbi:hypothetical protein I7X12_07925 [Halosimplex litoreum]|uniref:DUF7968 domain-containing protein n=1 Tax=Halosimplex litoreum TaxID=1198301 RepID=A0A7T3KWM0_9EURY|nr:hypothetical protein [Halosimplex litoreum]QPV64529.1 hypothetical protein I7X12_07925 [Halosimplex litoreum]